MINFCLFILRNQYHTLIQIETIQMVFTMLIVFALMAVVMEFITENF